MSDQEFNNPFSALFPTPEESNAFRAGVISSEILDRPSKSSTASPEEEESNAMQTEEMEEKERHLTSHFFEDIFRITLSKDPCCNKNGSSSLIFLNEVHVALRYEKNLDESSIERAVFERLLLEEPVKYVVRRNSLNRDDELTSEKRVIFYLYQCFYRLKTAKDFKIGPTETAHQVIITKTSSALCNPEMFPESKLAEELMKLALHYQEESGHSDVLSQFISEVAASVHEHECKDVAVVLKPAFLVLQEKLQKSSLCDRNLLNYIDILDYFTGSELLIKAVLRYSMPREITKGKAYQLSLIGLPLSVSCLPKSEGDGYEFFQEPSKYMSREHALTEERLSVPLVAIAKTMHRLFEKILRKSAETREMLLRWIGDCLNCNSSRAKIWNNQMPEVFASLHASDGFLINLTAVLLLLSKPFSEPCSPKLFKINPNYTSACLGNDKKKYGHLNVLAETTLVQQPEDHIPNEIKFNFITECFFFTHFALHIGFHVVNERMVKMNQELSRIQRLYEEARLQGGESSDVVQRIKDNMERGMTKFLTYRTALLVPETLDLMLKFHISTATWLVNLSTSEALNVFTTLKFPPANEWHYNLSFVPEFILENIIDCTIFVKRFSIKSLEHTGPNLDHFMTLIMMFMGSPERVKNPHLRAHLAEMLEALMPQSEEDTRTSLTNSVFRHKVFSQHLFIGELIPTLLNVFVSIEMTGQSVAFEQKFHYRRPMYIVLDYLWSFDIHKQKVKELADDAEKNMESPHPPLFLHFINLLINDAIFLLDEALTYMSKLREIQQAKDNGSWNSLSSDQQQQQEGNFQHIGMLAKFHNVMSNETISTLEWLTTEIKSIFCHPTIVERITGMLNYFLLHLVGPQKKNLKVKDLKEYEFKPHDLVRDICQIYENLGSSEDKYAEWFCAAVSRDGRSYTSDLFPLAQAVLNRIGYSVLALKFNSISKKVHVLALKQQHDDELMSGAPDDFLDPIMSTVMMDPVKLPSSGVVVDRPTIARHLLSDQTDPFNRSPLTMDMVIPDEELKSKIQKWFQERGSAS